MGDVGIVAIIEAPAGGCVSSSWPLPGLILFIFQTFLVPILAPHLAKLQAVCMAWASCLVCVWGGACIMQGLFWEHTVGLTAGCCEQGIEVEAT